MNYHNYYMVKMGDNHYHNNDYDYYMRRIIYMGCVHITTFIAIQCFNDINNHILYIRDFHGTCQFGSVSGF